MKYIIKFSNNQNTGGKKNELKIRYEAFKNRTKLGLAFITVLII